MLFPNEILRAHLIQVFYQIFIKLGDDPVQDKTNAYVSLNNHSSILSRKTNYAPKNYLCGFSDSKGQSYDQTTP